MVFILIENINNDNNPNTKNCNKFHEGDAGFDIWATRIIDETDDLIKLGTDIRVCASNPGYYIEAYPRSSISKVPGIIMANSVGIIDSGYRGELIIAFRKLRPDAKIPQLPWRCIQLIPKKRELEGAVATISLPQAGDNRGSGGFGSTN